MTRLALPRVVAALLLAAPGLAAQAHDHEAHTSPYAGLEGRDIKALSVEEVDGLLAGDGMGFALAAELNGLPGPKHALELQDQLELSAQQREALKSVFQSMNTEAQGLGASLVEAERHLDMMFAQGHATGETVRARTAEIAEIRGRLRASHLVAHLATRDLLTSEQIAAYARMRGYTADPPQ